MFDVTEQSEVVLSVDGDPLRFDGNSDIATSSIGYAISSCIPNNEIRFQINSDGGAILTLHANGAVSWTGDQSDAALAFWKCVEEMSPWRQPQPHEVQVGDWIHYTTNHDYTRNVGLAVSVLQEYGRTFVTVTGGWKIDSTDILEVRRGIPK